MFKPTHKKKTSINIIPMIDVIFFLLVFFMLFTSFRTNPYGMEMKLPKAVTVTEQQQENFVININEEGEFFYEGDNLPIAKISELAEEKHQNNNNLVVIINADSATKYSDIVTVMDSVRQVGIYNLALAAEKKGS
ncbi:MAG: biopolymer transporter ExbD [Halanaerobiales bacterium]